MYRSEIGKKLQRIGLSAISLWLYYGFINTEESRPALLEIATLMGPLCIYYPIRRQSSVSQVPLGGTQHSRGTVQSTLRWARVASEAEKTAGARTLRR